MRSQAMLEVGGRPPPTSVLEPRDIEALVGPV
jgi:hypothetical protein